MNAGKIFLPLNPHKLRSGEELTFNLYVKSLHPQTIGKKFELFCRRGETFNPGLLAKIKFNYANCVYYHVGDKDRVNYYLNPEDGLVIGSIRLLRHKRKPLPASISYNRSYLSMPIDNLLPAIKVNFDIFMKTKNISEMDYNYEIVLSKGDTCSPDLLNHLRRKNINYIYFYEQNEREAFHYFYHALGFIIKNNRISSAAKAIMIYNVAFFWARRFYSGKYERTAEDIQAGFRLIDYILMMLREDRHYGKWLPKLCRNGEKLYGHCLNTCILGMGFTTFLGFPDVQIKEISQGSLLHDLGMTEIPGSVLNKRGGLSKEEMNMIKNHPLDSCFMLQEISSLSPNSMIVISQHHEFGDGSGYTQGLKLPQIDHRARILRIVDSYEAMTSNRSWREKYSPAEALLEMRREWSAKGCYDTEYLVNFIKFLSGK